MERAFLVYLFLILEIMLLGDEIMMSNGIIFYWLSWMLVIIVTFIMRKNRKRTLLACWLFITIICSNFHITILGFQISIALLSLILGSILLLVQLSHLMYYLFSSFTITIGYTAMLLWEMNAPVWLFLPRIITIAFIIGLMTTILAQDFYSRLGISLFGTACGELIFSLILSSYGMHVAVGELFYFDCIIGVVVIFVLLNIFDSIRCKLTSTIHNYKNRSDGLIIR